MSWVKNTEREVDFIINIMDLAGSEQILDLACGFGRHANEFSRRGFTVTGVDITPEFIHEAEKTADNEGLDSKFICSDIRNLSVNGEYDVVLNIADGAIGYLEDDFENLKIYDTISSSLKKGGKHFMHINNAEYAEIHFPSKDWKISDNMVSLPEYHWEKATRRMLYGGWSIKFGEVVRKPENTDFRPHSAIRLYSIQEIEEIFNSRKMVIKKTFGQFDQTVPASHWESELLVYSEKL